MRKEFYIDGYDELLDELNEKYDCLFSALETFPVTENEDCTVYAYGMRIVVPECHLSIREGQIVSKEDEDCAEDAFIVYAEDEKDPAKYQDVYSNTGIQFLVHCALGEKGGNPLCYYDEDELVFWDFNGENT